MAIYLEIGEEQSKGYDKREKDHARRQLAAGYGCEFFMGGAYT